MSELKAVVLAAGKGTRLRTGGVDLPKVLRRALDRPLLEYVLVALPVKSREDVIIVVGYKREQVEAAFPGYAFAVQAEQLGTGHAVMSAAPALEGFSGHVLVCYGDMPLVRAETYADLWRAHLESDADCTLLSGRSELPLAFGRVARDHEGRFLRIIEDRDCTPEEKKIRELNSGIYIFRCKKLLSALSGLHRENAQGEYYLTDVPAIMRDRGDRVVVHVRDMGRELIGVNTLTELSMVEDILKGRD